MSKVSAFYSVNEESKPTSNRVYHNNSSCAAGKDIPAKDRCSGTNGYRLCKDCTQLNEDSK